MQLFDAELDPGLEGGEPIKHTTGTNNSIWNIDCGWDNSII